MGYFDSRDAAESFRKSIPFNERDREEEKYKIVLFIDPDWTGSKELLVNQTRFRNTIDPDQGGYITGVSLSLLFGLIIWIGLSYVCFKGIFTLFYEGVSCPDCCDNFRSHFDFEEYNTAGHVMVSCWIGFFLPFLVLFPTSTARSVNVEARKACLILMCLFAACGLAPVVIRVMRMASYCLHDLRETPRGLNTVCEACPSAFHLYDDQSKAVFLTHAFFMLASWFFPVVVLAPIAMCLENRALMMVTIMLIMIPAALIALVLLAQMVCYPCIACGERVRESRERAAAAQKAKGRETLRKAKELAAQMLRREQEERKQARDVAAGAGANLSENTPFVPPQFKPAHAATVVAVPVPIPVIPGAPTGVAASNIAVVIRRTPEQLIDQILVAQTEDELVGILNAVKDVASRSGLSKELRGQFIMNMRLKRSQSEHLWNNTTNRVRDAYGAALRARNTL